MLPPRYFIWLTSWDATLLGLALLLDYVLTLMLFLKRWNIFTKFPLPNYNLLAVLLNINFKFIQTKSVCHFL